MSEEGEPIEARIEALGIWSGAVDIAPLHGGLSNESYIVTTENQRFVVRFGKDYPFHHVSRQREIMTARAAFSAGLAPEIVHSADDVMISRFIDGRTYDAADVRREFSRIANLIRRFHADMPERVSGPGFMFWVFHVIRDYARTLIDCHSRLAGEVPGYLGLAREFETAQIPLPIVFGHNDLLPANFINDGERLWLIDFEYAGFSTAMFDLAGASANAQFSDGESEAFLAAYFGEKPLPELLRSHAAMQCAALLREAMWSMVSELHLTTPGVDFEAYTAENLDRLAIAFDAYRTRYGKT